MELKRNINLVTALVVCVPLLGLPFFSIESQPEGLLFNRNKEPLVKNTKIMAFTKRILVHSMELMCSARGMICGHYFIAGPSDLVCNARVY